jgi:photosystem II stability/assembly factor-like uncharacterized protein
MSRLRYSALTLVFGLALAGQPPSSDLLIGLSWRLVGPFRGGRSVAASGIPGDGRSFFFGSVDGGVWKTTDAGTVWTPIFDSQPVASIGALEVAPSNPEVIYAGTGESDIRSDLATGDGVYKSTDGGKTWKNAGLKGTRQISRIVTDPTNANVVFVAALGHAYAPNPERGVYRSRDGGQTWEKVLFNKPAAGAADIAIAPDAPRILFASLWNAHRPPWSTYAPIEDRDSPGGSGLFRSLDGGTTWTAQAGHGLPPNSESSSGWGRVGVAIAPGTGGKRVYALIDAGSHAPGKSGLYRSDDGGDNWVLANNDSRITSRAWYFSSITADPHNPDIVYIPNVALYKLADAGKTLSIVRGAPGGDDYHQLWVDPANSLRMVLATDQGTSVTIDGGETWSTWYNQPTAQFYHVITDNEFPYHIYGSQQDSGTAAVASRTDTGQIDTRDWFTVGGSESGYIAPDPKNPNIFYVSSIYGDVGRFDRRTKQTQNISPWPMPGFGSEINKRKFRDPWTPVLVFSSVESGALFLGTQFVMKTVDGGLHWQQISPDLTGAANNSTTAKQDGPTTPENAVKGGYGVVYSIASSPLDAGEIWAGSDTGLVHVTRDSGKTWTDVTPAWVSPGGSASSSKLPKWSKITQLEVSHSKRGEAYAAVDRHRLDDMSPYLYRTRDFGKTWTPITEGIAANAFLNCVREDPSKAGLLFAATEFGIYASFDDGDHWQSLQLNLPVTSVRDLVIHGNDLVAATHGRSFWVLDDIAPLRQINGSLPAVSLFKPSAAVRMTSDGFLGTPLPPEEPQASNPPRGAYIDFFLASRIDGEVRLEILDAAGKQVRRYSSADQAEPPPARAAIASRWFSKPQALSVEAGLHRFVWDLRYARTGNKSAGDDDEDDEGGPAFLGPSVMPGSYTVKLIAGGREFTQSLKVTMDPRSSATSAELAAQFDLASRVFDDMIRAKKAFAAATALRAQLESIREKLDSGHAALRDSIAALSAEVNDLMTGGKASPEEGLRYTSSALTAALGAVESADRTPPSQVRALYAESLRPLSREMEKWKGIESGALPKLNQQLKEAGIAPVQIAELEREAEESLAR